MYENLVLNPGLISMSPEEFDQHVAQITQAQARAEECARRPIQVPRDLPDLAGMSEVRCEMRCVALEVAGSNPTRDIFFFFKFIL